LFLEIVKESTPNAIDNIAAEHLAKQPGRQRVGYLAFFRLNFGLIKLGLGFRSKILMSLAQLGKGG
jgi:hypothetical protein